jgi:Uma2 family endonuclease
VRRARRSCGGSRRRREVGETLTSQPDASVEYDEYIAWEAAQSERFEYLNGVVYAMAPTSTDHNAIVLNLAGFLRNHARKLGCRVYVETVKVARPGISGFYPDLFLTCDARDFRSQYIVHHPRLVIEVLSRTTEEYNRGDKFATYRGFESLEEYVLVDSRSRRVEVHRRDNGWQPVVYGGGTVLLDGGSLSVPFDEIYEGTALATLRPPAR